MIDTPIREAFDRIAKCDTIRNMFETRFAKGWNLDVLNGMNEVCDFEMCTQVHQKDSA